MILCSYRPEELDQNNQVFIPFTCGSKMGAAYLALWYTEFMDIDWVHKIKIFFIIFQFLISVHFRNDLVYYVLNNMTGNSNYLEIYICSLQYLCMYLMLIIWERKLYVLCSQHDLQSIVSFVFIFFCCCVCCYSTVVFLSPWKCLHYIHQSFQCISACSIGLMRANWPNFIL